METTSVPGCERLIESIDQAMTGGSVREITRNVACILSDVIDEQSLDLPEALRRPAPESYARRLLYRSPEHGYAVLAMVWGPGQGTPIHDHSGIWCVEGVFEGHIEVTQYSLLNHDGLRYLFRPEGTVRAGVGSSGSLIPPFEYHTIANARQDRPAITIHVYGREMSACNIFEPFADDWYEARTRQLRYTA